MAYAHKSLQILHKCAHFVVINKPAGCHSQPTGFRAVVTVKDMLKDQYPELYNEDLKYPAHEPKLVHRLDSHVSGAMVLGTSALGTKMLSRNLKMGGNHGWKMTKTYAALLEGTPASSFPLSGSIDMPIDDKPSQTLYTLYPSGSRTLVQFTLLTGRKHQLRIHARDALQLPIVRINEEQIALHSHQLEIHAGRFSALVQAPITSGFEAWDEYLDDSMRIVFP